jgi:acyl-CoA synthetase (NDP forming)
MSTPPSALHIFSSARRWAVIGASPQPQKVGHQVLRNLLQNMSTVAKRQIKNTLQGSEKSYTLYPINPHEKSILGLPVSASMSEVRLPIDVAVIATPAQTVMPILEEIVERNELFADRDRVKGIILITAGFAEQGEKGSALQKQILELAHKHHLALIGPNTLGFLNPYAALNASFGPPRVAAGPLGVISQSGAILSALFDQLAVSTTGGVSFAVSLGNAGGVDEAQALEYAVADPHTKVVCCYIESFKQPRAFFELAAKVRKTKPIVLLKGGLSQAGQRASASHTAALATDPVLIEQLCAQSGVVQLHTVEELLQAARYFSRHHRPISNVMIVTNAGGPAVNTVDVLSHAEVPLATWSSAAKDYLEHALPPNVHVANPLDLIGDADAVRLDAALKAIHRDPGVDAALIILTKQATTDIPAMIETLRAQTGRTPLFVSVMSTDQTATQVLSNHPQIFLQDYPNEHAELLRIAGRAAEAMEVAPSFITAPPANEPLKDASLRDGLALLKAAGMHTPQYSLITHADDIPMNPSFPLFAKSGNVSLAHKKDLGAIYGKVASITELRQAVEQLLHFGPVWAQEFVPPGVELLLGFENDLTFGWYFTLGLGGSQSNILNDRVYLFAPCSFSVLTRRWRSTKAAQFIKQEAPDQENELLRQIHVLQQLVVTVPNLVGLEINPLTVTKDKILAVDLKVRLQ